MTKKEFIYYDLKITSTTKHSMLINNSRHDYLIFVGANTEGFLIKSGTAEKFTLLSEKEFLNKLVKIEIKK